MRQPHGGGAKKHADVYGHRDAGAYTREQAFAARELRSSKQGAEDRESWQHENDQHAERDPRRLRDRNKCGHYGESSSETRTGKQRQASPFHPRLLMFRAVLVSAGTQEPFSIRVTSKIWMDPES